MAVDFTYGDLLIGNRESNREYSETTEGTKWVFIGLWIDELGRDDDDHEVYDEEDANKMLVLSLEDWNNLNSTNLFYPFTTDKVTQWEYVVEDKYFYSHESALKKSNQYLAMHVLEKYDS